MELVLNLSMLGPQPTGLGVYSENCTNGIARRFRTCLIAGGGAMPPGDVLLKAPASVAIGGGKLAAIRRQLWMRSIDFGDNRLVYSPTHHGLPAQGDQIITIHDLICLRFPSQHRPQYLFFRFGLPRLLKKCRAVFTVSETTRQDVASTYGFPLENIYVVPNGVDASAFSPDPEARAVEPYLLMVGARYSHKNVDEVLDVANHWSKRFRLVVTSCGGEYRAALEKKVAALGLRGRVEFTDYLSRADLIRLYQGCSALVYPSKWEGFGIPPLEALACGSPVIASDIPVHREVLGDAAFFVRLGDPSSWAEALEAIQTDSEVAGRMAVAGDRLRRFTWGQAVNALEQGLLAVEPALEACRLIGGAPFGAGVQAE
ncbi:glycosyltransferase family 4 protein [Denitromonas iodatirespirans]|uniref:Glycosyltransferase family 4 protein n=1 Tax=Denitromonas iodatirespirans TaxID=2795389 RepID=A0A944DA36_DENI1|nr:glycosyltransferase family 1 protein [Denitromonas iodatirespirans]MBT0962759.1 glycosyltransferase family 4 protein [Denitromonas iodatirespirans]